MSKAESRQHGKQQTTAITALLDVCLSTYIAWMCTLRSSQPESFAQGLESALLEPRREKNCSNLVKMQRPSVSLSFACHLKRTPARVCTEQQASVTGSLYSITVHVAWSWSDLPRSQGLNIIHAAHATRN